MNEVTISVTIPPESQALIRKMSNLPVDIPLAIKRGMDYSLDIVRGRIQRSRLSGKGPYPPSEHRLGVVTQQLQQSLRAEPAVITGNVVTGDIAAIGSQVFYGAFHEFGLFKKGVVRGTKSGGRSKPYDLNIPERAPVRTGVTENSAFIVGAIADEIDKAFKDVAKP